MVFEITGKVAIITGGASGLGLSYAKELLKHGLWGVTLADLDKDHGARAVADIEQAYGKNKVIFVQTDVTDKRQFEEAFKKTVATFKNIDILINNAGLLNDSEWEKEIKINVNGLIQGVLLGLENYIPKYRTGSEGVIVNISSTAGVRPYSCIPVYVGTKFAVLGMSLSWGDARHYECTKVKVLTFCPGPTDTPLIRDIVGKTLSPRYENLRKEIFENLTVQTVEHCAKSLVEVIIKAESGTAWVTEDGEPPYEFILAKGKNREM